MKVTLPKEVAETLTGITRLRKELRDLKSDLEEVTGNWHSARARQKNAEQEVERLGKSNCEFQLKAHNLAMERGALFQALMDCQKLRKQYQDRVQQLESSLEDCKRRSGGR